MIGHTVDYYAPTHLAETREGVYEYYSQADADRLEAKCKDLWREN